MRAFLQKDGDRREFFRASVRYGLLAALAGFTAVSLRKQPAEDQKCVNSGICRGCAVFAGCGLPQALSAKEFIRRAI